MNADHMERAKLFSIYAIHLNNHMCDDLSLSSIQICICSLIFKYIHVLYL